MTANQIKLKAIKLKQGDSTLSSSEIAMELGTTKDVVQKVLKAAGLGMKKTPYHVPTLPPLMKLTGNWLVIQDLHSFTMSKPLLDMAIDRGLFHGVDGAVIGGDIFNLDRFSKYPSIISPVSLNRELDACMYANDLLVTELMKVKIILGNHDMRLLYKLEGDLDAQRIVGLIASPEIQPHIGISTRNYCMVKSGGEDWMVSHEFKYSKNRTAVSRALATMHRCHVIHGHQHLVGKTMTDDGRYWAIDNGCMCRQDRTAYASMLVSSMPRFQQGFTIIKDGEGIVYAMRGKKLERL